VVKPGDSVALVADPDTIRLLPEVTFLDLKRWMK
jgi:hypothetical protein